METKLSDARVALKDIISKLERIVPGTKLEEPMILHAITPHVQILETSFGREVSNLGLSSEMELTSFRQQLWFASLHAVHHWSMVCLRVPTPLSGLTPSEGTRNCWRAGSWLYIISFPRNPGDCDFYLAEYQIAG
jgi:hypothetical protein